MRTILAVCVAVGLLFLLAVVVFVSFVASVGFL